MIATILTYNENGREFKKRAKIDATLAWNEEPPVLSVEIPTAPGRYLGVQVPIAEIEAKIRAMRQSGHLK